jgi:5-(carboxyamino)imidazole ribonucleotide mutase
MKGIAMKVGVLMGSANDADKMKGAVEILREFDVEVTEHVMSAHRTPERVQAFASGARDAGYAAIICGAGMAAHLAGAVAAQTTLPVIGVPLSGGALNGVDALYATVQMPRGMPVATVAIDNSTNAGLLAIAILGVTDEGLAKKLTAYRDRWRDA